MSELRPKYLEAVRDGLGLSGVSGSLKADGGGWLGDAGQQPEGSGYLSLDHAIHRSVAIGCVASAPSTAITGGVSTYVTGLVASYDPFSMLSLTDRITIKRPGVYYLGVFVSWSAGSVFKRVRLFHNGVVVTGQDMYYASAVWMAASIAWACDEFDVIRWSLNTDTTEDAAVNVAVVRFA